MTEPMDPEVMNLTRVNLTNALFAAALKSDFLLFAKKAFKELHGGEELELNWHHEIIARVIEDVYYGRENRVIITLPPRYLKSFMLSVAAPAWMLGNDAAKQILCVSYSDILANSLSEKCKKLMECFWYKQAFGTVIDPKRTNTKTEYNTKKGGGRFATSTGGTITGFGGNVIIVDDPIKAEDARSENKINDCINWYGSTLYSRMNDKKKDAIIIVMQRLHEDDLAGHVQENEDWRVIDMPAIAPEDTVYHYGADKQYHREKGELLHEAREGHAELEAIRKNLGTMTFETQYQQNPVPAEGNVFKRDWLIQSSDVPETYDRIVQSWDTAVNIGDTNDYSVCTTWGIIGTTSYLIDTFREKLEFPALYKKVKELRARYKADILLIEKAASGPQLMQQLRTEGIKSVARNPQGMSKEERAWGVTSKFEGGHVILPEKAHWLDTYIKELLAFPRTKHDDQVDSTTQFLHWFSHIRNQRKNGRVPAGSRRRSSPRR